MTLIDPEKVSRDQAFEMASMARDVGSAAIMIGGSTGVRREHLDETIDAIREGFLFPLILFPSSASDLSPRADAVYFMSLLNSKDRRFIIGEQIRGSRIVKEMKLEPISLGYIVVEPGMEVGRVGNADLISRDDIEKAVSYALCAQYFGMSFVYLEAGSGAPEPISPEMITAVRNAIEIPLIIGGGIRSPEHALRSVEAGADVIVTGTVVEEDSDARSVLSSIVNAIHGVRR